MEKNEYFSNVFHMSELKFNLFSADAALDKELWQYSNDKICTFMKNGRKKGKIIHNEI